MRRTLGAATAARAVGLAIAALGLAACGAASPTLARLRSEATHVCTLADRRSALIPAPPGPAGAAAFLRSGLTVLEPELSQLRRLQPPSDTTPVFHAAIASFGGEVRAISQTVSALESGTDPGIAMRDLQRRLAPFESAQDGAWQALGVPACVKH